MFFEAIFWQLYQIKEEKINKIFKESQSSSIVQLRNNTNCYIIKGFPYLSKQETTLAQKVFERFLEQKKSKKQKNIFNTLLDYCAEKQIELDEEQKEYLARVLESVINGFGVFDNFLQNDNIEEVAVIGCGREKPVYVYEKNFGWLCTNAFVASEEGVFNLANKMAMQVGRHLSHSNPSINAFLPNGSRLNASIPPFSLEPTITIRKFREKPFTPLDLALTKTVSINACAFLWLAMQTDLSVLICGNTGSGKTTTLNAVFCFVPKNERIIVAEETPEINLPHEHVARLKTVEEIGINMNDLITTTLRMRPDRVIIGEIRTNLEVKAFVNTVLAGQGKGSIATFHAKSALEAVLRLQKLGVEKADICSIDLLIVQKRWDEINMQKKIRRETRKVTQICEVVENEENVELNMLFEFDFKKKELVEKNKSRKVLQKICDSFGFTEKKALKELEKRAMLLQNLLSKDLSQKDFFSVVNNEF